MPRYQESPRINYHVERVKTSPAERLRGLCELHPSIAEAVNALREADKQSKGALLSLGKGKPAIYLGVAHAQQNLREKLGEIRAPKHLIHGMVNSVTAPALERA